MKRKITGLLILAVFISLFSVTGCYKDDEARVTIHIERNDLIGQKPVQKKWFIDRILEFFSSPVYGGGWQNYKTDMKMKITSSSFSEMNFELPDGSTEYTTIIPSGSNINFLITTEYYDSYITFKIQKNWGGTTTVDIAPGEQDITIKMIPMTWVTLSPSAGIIDVSWQSTSYATSYKLYRATSSEGPYTLILNNTSTFKNESSSDGLVAGTTYYCKVSVVSSYGEGVACDPQSALFN